MRKKYVFTPLLFFFILCTLSLNAQNKERPLGIGLRVNAANYIWPLDSRWNTDDFKYALELEYVGHLNRILNIAVPLKLGNALYPSDEMGNVENGGRISLDALLQLKLFNEESFFYPSVFAGGGAVLEQAKDFNFEVPFGLGLNFRMAWGAYLSLKGEYRLGLADFRDNIQLSAGVLLVLGKGDDALQLAGDSDGDGLPDAEDLCPNKAGPLTTNGCPDTDRDGVPDNNDYCPDLAGPIWQGGCPDTDKDGLVDKDDNCPRLPGPSSNRGCPLPPQPMDRDGDGLSDREDECPDVAGDKNLRGCPDSDADGIPNIRDRCPNEAGLTRTDGCPDRDQDDVIDREDRCPDTAGSVANSGCPELTREEKDVLTFATQAIQFETGSNRLTLDSYGVLNRIFDILERYPNHSLRISGYSDSIGSYKTNQKLSERRARTCYDYLFSKGVASRRMEYIGFGESNPIADNRYKAGREKNRRVEFEIYLED